MYIFPHTHINIYIHQYVKLPGIIRKKETKNRSKLKYEYDWTIHFFDRKKDKIPFKIFGSLDTRISSKLLWEVWDLSEKILENFI